MFTPVALETPGEANRVAAYSDARRLDQRAPAILLEQANLFDGRLDVIKPSVVPVRLQPVP